MAPSGHARVDAEQLLRTYRSTGDRALRDRVVADHRWLAVDLARRLHHGGEPLEDLVQVASLGLLKATEGFDPDHGAPFTAYASVTIRGELRRHYRDHGWSIRVPRRLQELRYEIREAQDTLSNQLQRAPTPSEVAARLHVSSEDVIDALCADDNYRSKSLDVGVGDGPSLGERLGGADPNFDLVDADDAFRALTARCGPRTRQLLAMRYVEGATQSEIAARLGVSQVQVSRLLAHAHRALRSRARDAVTGAPP